jgi:hypothetical protein
MLEGWYFGERPTQALTQRINEQLNDGRKLVKYNSPRLKLTESVALTGKKSDLERKAQSLKFGIFLTTYMYFQALYLLKNLKSSWSGITETRENQKNSNIRDALLKTFFEKAKSGDERIIKRKEEERAIAVRDILIICTAFCSSVLEACCC